jgi:molybdopterin-guanine dinucleotide biosynthesis protein A
MNLETNILSSSRICAVVLAGGRVPKKLAPLCAYRPLLPIAGRPMLDYVLAALRETMLVRASAVVAPEAVLAEFPGIPETAVPAGESIVENMRNGARALADHAPTHLLFLTGDLPLITAHALTGYLTASLVSGAALTYPIIPREASEERFPGAKRTYVKIMDGTFTGGNAIFTTADLLTDKGALIQSLYDARKEPLKLAGILGWPTVWGMIRGTLTIAELEAVASRILDAPVKAIITPYPEIGFDVDKPSDAEAVEKALKS